MTIRDAEDLPVAALLGVLERGGKVRTGVSDPEKTDAAGPIYLSPEDTECSGCGEAIGADEFPGADWANVLARQKLLYGHTMCRVCHDEVSGCE